MNSQTENVFYFLDKETGIISEREDLVYLESLQLVLENWLDGEIRLSEPAAKEDIRKAIQLAVLKGMKEHVQPHHQMTPDSLGLLISYFAELFMKKEVFTILDPAAGTGNLLLTVMNYLDGRTSGTAVEIDDLLIRIAAASAELTEQPVTFYRQDALSPLLIDPADAVIADLPIGYYPDTETASGYELKSDDDMSYAHHLFIEQAIRHTKEGGYLFLVIPQSLFESPEAPKLHAFLKNTVHIQAVMELPEIMVKNSAFAKSVLILQKQQEELRAPGEVLLARVPNLSNKTAMVRFFTEVDNWFKESKQ
ncbi:class I SAM-dependent methyltransferase [Planococcus lenghuensis]|uniref:SAM-dependent methyltransferase n=1 Tax=Planococcus lenghuensis TaxID=2213202 RepID=A0A1Q2KX78_9BACL|nr:class I SAM-dependent methyltransferase [Planococcus lenghuensis]AQQ52801.1 SAM-dependent methyltransferase [Planococcus lenghuensis]